MQIKKGLKMLGCEPLWKATQIYQECCEEVEGQLDDLRLVHVLEVHSFSERPRCGMSSATRATLSTIAVSGAGTRKSANQSRELLGAVRSSLQS